MAWFRGRLGLQAGLTYEAVDIQTLSDGSTQFWDDASRAGEIIKGFANTPCQNGIFLRRPTTIIPPGTSVTVGGTHGICVLFSATQDVFSDQLGGGRFGFRYVGSNEFFGVRVGSSSGSDTLLSLESWCTYDKKIATLPHMSGLSEDVVVMHGICTL